MRSCASSTAKSFRSNSLVSRQVTSPSAIASSRPRKIEIKNPADYEAALEKAFVIADREKRRTNIFRAGRESAAAAGFQLKKDEGLLEEVTGLVEYPVVHVATIDKNYMDLPKEVLVSEMRAHQKYFALENKDGTLSDKFLITANTNKGEKNIIAGNERVLRARLADGRFFWDQDRKKKLEDMAAGLKSVTYHAKLGSVADKVSRIEKLAVELAPYMESSLRGAQATKQSSPGSLRFARDDVMRAAALCKADLVSGMVGEFPDLQGVMGRYYALEQKNPPTWPMPSATIICRLPLLAGADQACVSGRGAGRQARYADLDVRHRRKTDRQQRPVCPAPFGAWRYPHYSGKQYPPAAFFRHSREGGHPGPATSAGVTMNY